MDQTRPHQSLHVLIADDNYANCMIVQILLERSGHRVDKAYNGQQALEKCKSQTYDIIILDVEMPVMSGLKAMRKIRQTTSSNKDSLIFALTAHCPPKGKHRLLAVGFDAVLFKPLHNSDFDSILQKVSPRHKKVSKIQGDRAFFQKSALLDEKKIEQLCRQHSLEGLLEIEQQLWSSIRTQCLYLNQTLPMALEAKGVALSEFRRAAHTIMLASASFGLVRIEQICRQLRNAPRNRINSLMDSFVEAMTETRPALRQTLTRARQLNTPV